MVTLLRAHHQLERSSPRRRRMLGVAVTAEKQTPRRTGHRVEIVPIKEVTMTDPKPDHLKVVGPKAEMPKPEHVDAKAYFEAVASLRKPLEPLINKVEILAEVRVGRVGGDDWFQVNPDQKMQAYGYVLKDKDKTYRYVHDSMWTHPILIKRLKPVLLCEVTTFPPSGAIITPFHVPDPDREISAYTTAWKGYLQAQSGIWTQLTWSMERSTCRMQRTIRTSLRGPAKIWRRSLAVGFEKKLILSEDDPYVQQLRGDPTRFDRFDRIWQVDFEYRQNRNLLPVPVCMCAIDQRTGQEIFLWRKQLLELRQAPFGTGPRDLIVAYSASAELGCFLQLGWRLPENILDPFLETAALTNGNSTLWAHKWRAGLLDALQIFGLHGIDAGEKDEMRDLILNHETYDPDQRRRIRDYNRSDVIATSALLLAIADRIDMPYALLRGRYQKPVTSYEIIGIPVDTAAVAELLDNRAALKLDYIERNNMGEFFDGTRFIGNRLVELILRNGWETHWPLTPTGKFETGDETLGRMAALHPALAPLARLHSQLGALRGSELANSIGADGYARCPIRPFHTLTGRNQPHGRDRIFIPALPQWLHGVIKPPAGWACSERDWSAQEIELMAAQSGDQNMIADFLRGDCHTDFGIRAGLITEDTEPEARALIRNKQAKPVTLGSNYGMTPYGIQRKTGKSWEWSKHIHRQHHVVYPTFHEWRDNVVTQARFHQRIESPYGWPMFVGYDTSSDA